MTECLCFSDVAFDHIEVVDVPAFDINTLSCISASVLSKLHNLTYMNDKSDSNPLYHKEMGEQADHQPSTSQTGQSTFIVTAINPLTIC